MKLQTLILCAALLAGCSSPARRPITEPIPLDEMNSLLKNEPGYGTVIVLAETFREGATSLDLARANDLTYKQLFEFFNSYTDPQLHEKLSAEAEQQWQERFSADYARTDSIIDHWQQYLDQNKPDSYVRVELQQIDPKQSTYGSAQVTLEITPLKGPLDKVEGAFGIFKRDREHSFGDFSQARHNTFAFERGLRTTATCQAGMSYSIWDITDGDIPYNMYPDQPGLPLGQLLEKYCFDYSITTLVKDGKQIRFIDIFDSIPLSVRSYWAGQDNESDDEYLRANIVRELTDPEFREHSEYLNTYRANYFRDLDSLAAWIVIDRL